MECIFRILSHPLKCIQNFSKYKHTIETIYIAHFWHSQHVFIAQMYIQSVYCTWNACLQSHSLHLSYNVYLFVPLEFVFKREREKKSSVCKREYRFSSENYILLVTARFTAMDSILNSN